jgi:hypothetical protein
MSQNQPTVAPRDSQTLDDISLGTDFLALFRNTIRATGTTYFGSGMPQYLGFAMTPVTLVTAGFDLHRARLGAAMASAMEDSETLRYEQTRMVSSVSVIGGTTLSGVSAVVRGTASLTLGFVSDSFFIVASLIAIARSIVSLWCSFKMYWQLRTLDENALKYLDGELFSHTCKRAWTAQLTVTVQDEMTKSLLSLERKTSRKAAELCSQVPELLARHQKGEDVSTEIRELLTKIRKEGLKKMGIYLLTLLLTVTIFTAMCMSSFLGLGSVATFLFLGASIVNFTSGLQTLLRAVINDLGMHVPAIRLRR